MATDKVKTAFRLPSWVNQEFNVAAPPPTTSRNYQQQQNIKQFTSENVSKYTQEKTWA